MALQNMKNSGYIQQKNKSMWILLSVGTYINNRIFTAMAWSAIYWTTWSINSKCTTHDLHEGCDKYDKWLAQ